MVDENEVGNAMTGANKGSSYRFESCLVLDHRSVHTVILPHSLSTTRVGVRYDPLFCAEQYSWLDGS